MYLFQTIIFGIHISFRDGKQRNSCPFHCCQGRCFDLEFVLLNWGKRLSTTCQLPLALWSTVLTTTFRSAFNIKVPCALKIYEKTFSCTVILNGSTAPYLLTQDPGWVEVKRSTGISHELVKRSLCKPEVWGLIHDCSERGEHRWYQRYDIWLICS